MTATPRYYTPRLRREAGELDVEVASMDDEAAFGPVLHRLSFGEAIERDLLSDYQVVVVGVDDRDLSTCAERGAFVTRDGKQITDARTLAGQIGLAKTMRKYDLHRDRLLPLPGERGAGVQRRDARRDRLDARAARGPPGSLWSDHVSGTMTQRRSATRLLLSFRDLHRTSAACSATPAASARASTCRASTASPSSTRAARPSTSSRPSEGRSARPPTRSSAPSSSQCSSTRTADPDEALDDSAFKPVWDVVKALRAHDEALGEELDELRRRLGCPARAPGRPGKIAWTFQRVGRG